MKKWGLLIYEIGDVQILKVDEKTKIYIHNKDQVRKVDVHVNDKESFSFTDTIINLTDDHFIRTLPNGNTFEYKKGEQMKVELKQKPRVFMSTVPKDPKYNFNIITLDLETREKFEGDTLILKKSEQISNIKKLEPISAAYYDGLNKKTYFLKDYNSSNNMISSMLTELFSNPKNHGKVVYVHNFTGFDSMFLIKLLAEFSDKFKIIKKDDMVISLKVGKLVEIEEHKKRKNVEITFLDSMLMLPSSLKELGIAFGGSNPKSLKGEFDHNISNSVVDLNEIRNEILEYNVQDCVVLYEVLEKFSRTIFDLFKLNIQEVPTIASLALKIYRSNYISRRSWSCRFRNTSRSSITTTIRQIRSSR